jgi:hypothetical protein
MRPLLFLIGLLLLVVPEVLRVYYIMPFPGSQEDVATDLRQVDIAYWLHRNVWWLRLLGLALVVGPALHYIRSGGWGRRVAVLLPLALAATVFYLFNFRFMADRMFLPVEHKVMAAVAQDTGGANDLVLAVERNGEARAYPIELIGYHHQVLDTIGGEAVMITYCTVCRTGRAFSPVVNGQPETFRLVGMDHFNAMFEDSRTGSWWRQATGECIAGPLKGALLVEVPCSQMTRGAFTRFHQQGLVMQPDPAFTKEYEGLKDYDEGTMASSLEGRDTASWRPKSWVVGVVLNGMARAYDWNALVRSKQMTDSLGGGWINLRISDDLRTFIVDQVDTAVVEETDGNMMVVVHSKQIPAHQEFWHSWRTFHPNTTRYEPKR